mmetsp:Transcript_7924/g.18986  ORF Transcript_7924/g.18986 Transcript_7924/m.18986 type:complete len:97 (-) Transcript_7924:104-394(-)
MPVHLPAAFRQRGFLASAALKILLTFMTKEAGRRASGTHLQMWAKARGNNGLRVANPVAALHGSSPAKEPRGNVTKQKVYNEKELWKIHFQSRASS